jgi:serine/threonine protein kinase
MSTLETLAFNQEVSLMEFFADSPFIAKLVGFSKEPVCLIMKLYPFGSLDTWAEKNPEVINGRNSIKIAICKDVADGIAVMHSRQVAHCDLKPQNILVEVQKDRPHFLLTDFGISKILTDEYLASAAFQIRNLRGLTVSYAAPDALQRFRQKAPCRAIQEKAGDLYSYACVIYFVLSLVSPWE